MSIFKRTGVRQRQLLLFLLLLKTGGGGTTTFICNTQKLPHGENTSFLLNPKLEAPLWWKTAVSALAPGSGRASRRPISCAREWKHLEEIWFPFTASTGPRLLCLVLSRPLCTSSCHSGSCSYTSAQWWDRWVFLSFLNPAPCTLFSRCLLWAPLSQLLCVISLIKSVGPLDSFFRALPLFLTSHSPNPQRFW